MNLTPREKDKLMIALAAMVARGRLAKGIKPNYPESIALIKERRRCRSNGSWIEKGGIAKSAA
jgi:urease gamma subunit